MYKGYSVVFVEKVESPRSVGFSLDKTEGIINNNYKVELVIYLH
jgi:hypothetical protein